MKKLLSFTLFVACVAYCNAGPSKFVEPSKGAATQHLHFRPFDTVDVSSAIHVLYIQSNVNEPSAIVSAPSNVLPWVKLKQNGNLLEVYVDNDISLKRGAKIVVTLYAPAVNNVSVSGASSFKCAAYNAESSSLEIIASGASNVYYEYLDVKAVSCDASGASNVELIGRCADANLDCSGASEIDAEKLIAKSGRFSASGASLIKASAVKVMENEASGASSVKVKVVK